MSAVKDKTLADLVVELIVEFEEEDKKAKKTMRHDALDWNSGYLEGKSFAWGEAAHRLLQAYKESARKKK